MDAILRALFGQVIKPFTARDRSAVVRFSFSRNGLEGSNFSLQRSVVKT